VPWPLLFSQFHNHVVCCDGGSSGDYDDYVKILEY